jgi:Iron/manganese superoxide dismutases, alpha-hairpin domain
MYNFIKQLQEGRVIKKLEQVVLPYARDGLGRSLSKKAVDYHYGKLYGGYVDRFNAGEAANPAQQAAIAISKKEKKSNENFAEEFTNYQGLRPPKNVPGTNLFPGQDIVGQRVYHCTNSLEAIKKSGGLRPRRDATGEREYGRLSTDEHPFIPVIGIWFSVGKPNWVGKHCVSFVIEPTDQVYVAYANTKGLKPNVVLNTIALDRLTVEGQQDVDENFADGKNPQDKGDSKRHGVNTKASVSSLRKTAKQGGRKGQLAHWLANMKSGRAKANKK